MRATIKRAEMKTVGHVIGSNGFVRAKCAICDTQIISRATDADGIMPDIAEHYKKHDMHVARILGSIVEAAQ